VRDEVQAAQALSILQDVASAGDGEPWFCRGCREANDATMRICWNCGRSYE
jgi:hypothetical protein